MTRPEADAQCRDVVTRCIRALDGRDYDTVAGSFAADGVWDRAGEALAGPEAVRQALDKRPADLETQHLISNMVVDFPSETSAVVSYTLAAYAQRSGSAYHLHAIFKANDRLVTDGATWRFQHRAAVPAFSAQG